MNPRHRRKKHIDESSPSSDLFSSSSEGDGYAETRSASIRRDADVRETARALMSRSADVTRRGISVAKGSSVGTNTGRPLARQRRSPAGSRPSDRVPVAAITARARDPISAVPPANRRHTSRHASPSRLQSSRHSSEHDAMPRVDLKRTRGTSTISGAGTGGPSASIKTKASSVLSSPQKATTGIADPQPRPSQSVRFSRIDKRTSKSKEIGIRVPSRTAVPTSTRSFIPWDHESPDNSSSSSSSDTSELEVRKTRTRSKSRGKGSAKLTSRAGISGSRGVHSINVRKASSKRSPRETVGRKLKAVDPARYPSRKRSSSDDASSSGSVSSTVSSSVGSSSTEESRDDDAVPVKDVIRTPSAEKQQTTTASQTEETLATRPVCIFRASQTDILKPAKRAASRPTPSSPSETRRTHVASSVQSAKMALKATRGSTRRDTSGKVSSLPTSSAEVVRGRDQLDTAPISTTTPSIERVSSAEPSTTVAAGIVHSSTGLADQPSGAGVADSSQDVAAPSSSASPVISGRRRFAEKVADILERLLPEEQAFAALPKATVPGDRREAAVSETATPDSVAVTSNVGLDGSSDVVGGAPDEHRGRQNDSVTPQLAEPAGHMEPLSDVQLEKQGGTQGSTVPQCEGSLTEAVHLTPGDDRVCDTELATKAEPTTAVATELEPSSSYLGVGVVIPPSMPTEDSVKMQSSAPPTEDTKGRTVAPESRPPPEWSVAPEPRREAPMESPIPEVTRSRLWQPWILCSAAGAMILLPLAFVLIPLISSAASGAKRHVAPRSSQNGTEPDGKVGSVTRQEVYVDDADVPISCNGNASTQLDNVSAVAVSGAYSAPYKGDSDPRPQFRPLLCVFETEFFHPKRPYTLLQIPTPLCTTVVFYSVSLYRFSGAVDGGFRRPLDAELFENISASRLEGTLLHRGRRIPLYVTFGGRRSDSADYVRMLRDSTWRKASVEGIVNDTGSERPKYDGVNLDWNHPGDQCDVLEQPQLFHVLVESLVANRVKVMLTVPPLPRYVALYDLDPLLDGLEHVVLTTHKLRPRRSSVDCSGGRLYAAPAFREIRDSYSAAYRKKFAYSVSAGGDTFVTRTVALGAAAQAVPPPTSGLVLRPNKTSFESVCNVKPLISNPTEKECVVAIMQIEKSLDGGVVYYVAAYAGPKQLQERMHRAYEDDMGDAPVAVYDAFLDDFAGLCPGDSPRMSPQLAAIAESTTRLIQ